jgi:hypothetical protein
LKPEDKLRSYRETTAKSDKSKVAIERACSNLKNERDVFFRPGRASCAAGMGFWTRKLSDLRMERTEILKTRKKYHLPSAGIMSTIEQRKGEEK